LLRLDQRPGFRPREANRYQSHPLPLNILEQELIANPVFPTPSKTEYRQQECDIGDHSYLVFSREYFETPVFAMGITVSRGGSGG
jgi:hypothetical protein